MKVSKILILFSALFQTAMIMGQNTFNDKEYAQWSTVSRENLSPDLKWLNYTLTYDRGKDTLFLQNRYTMEKYNFPGGAVCKYSPDGHWVAIQANNGVFLMNLISHTNTFIDKAQQIEFLLEGKYILIILTENEIHLKNTKQHTSEKIYNVKEIAVNRKKSAYAYLQENNELVVVDLKKKHSTSLLPASLQNRKHIIWSESGKSIALLEETESQQKSEANHRIYFLRNILGESKLFLLDPQKRQEKEINVLFQPVYSPLEISLDDERVFFYKKKKIPDESITPIPEIWNSLDPLEYPRKSKVKTIPYLMVWYPEKDSVRQITTDNFPNVYLTPDGGKALIFDENQSNLRLQITGEADIWLIGLRNEITMKILNKQSLRVRNFSISPNARYINYCKNGKWMVYDIKNDTHTWIAKDLTDPIEPHYFGNIDAPYHFKGWVKDNEHLIFESKYDVWLVSASGKNSIRITNGREDSMVFSVSDPEPTNKILKFYNLPDWQYDLKKGILIQAFNPETKAKGYYQWKDSRLKKIVCKDADISRMKSFQNNTFLFIEQHVSKPPEIKIRNHLGKEETLLKTNAFHTDYPRIKTELINYTNTNGEKLQGILYYPVHYKVGKKYPTVVHIYEKQSHLLHKFYKPTQYVTTGFNPANYVMDDYFVFYPDITYQQAQPGLSALDCVEEGVKTLLKRKDIDQENIGLIGHSFGGYEVCFIITQSSLFKTAVAGASVTDFVSHSLSTETSGRSQMWRYQSHQPRMAGILYDDFESFRQNSPITHADRINIPFLLWTGSNDPQVNPIQSMMMHMAMRNLNKQNVLLQYSDEPHILLKKKNQKDLTRRIKEWFDFYLKNIPVSESWIN